MKRKGSKVMLERVVKDLRGQVGLVIDQGFTLLILMMKIIKIIRQLKIKKVKWILSKTVQISFQRVLNHLFMTHKALN